MFFAGNAKPSSMRRALPQRLGIDAPVVLVTEAMSLVRERRWPSLAARVRTRSDVPYLREYTPIHFPERIPVCGAKIRGFGVRTLRHELDCLLVPRGTARRVVCYDSPTQYPLVGALGEDLSVYLAIDDRTVTVQGEAIAGELEAERELLARVDRVVCVSEPLAETLRARAMGRGNLPIDVLTNGFDERLFMPERAWAEPEALRGLPRPRVLVAGHLSERIDWEGIRAASLLRPEWSWVFIGPAEDGMAERVAHIQAASGARMLVHPPVPYESVAAWVAHCDACAVPYRLNDFTRASSPLKAIEYLACGAPVLATEIPSLLAFNDAISWLREGDGTSYAAALDGFSADARSAAAVERRCRVVRDENWHRKAQSFCELVVGNVQLASGW